MRPDTRRETRKYRELRSPRDKDERGRGSFSPSPPTGRFSRCDAAEKRPTNSAREISYEMQSYLLFARLAAHRAFMSCDNLLLPAGVSPPFLGLAVVLAAPPVPLRLAHRALAAADNFARVLADIARRPL